LRDLGLHQGRGEEMAERFRRLCEEHVKKGRFLERLKRVGLA
jgi:hypothetical protein